MTNELSADARALIDQARTEEELPQRTELERIRENVVAGAVASAVMLAAPHAAGFAAGTTPLALVGFALKGGAAGALVALAAFGADHYLTPSAAVHESGGVRDERPSPPPARPIGVAHPPTSAVASPPAPERESAPRPSSPVTLPTDAPSTTEGSSSSPSGASVGSMEASADLREETVLLKRVQQELRAGRGAEALRLLDASSPRLEHGQLRQERLAAEILAACQIGDRERARRSARALAAENPATPSSDRLRGSCVGSEFFVK